MRESKPSIGRALKERRAYHGWSLADLSEKTNLSKSTLSKIENDLISPSYQSILQLCAGLGIEIGDLVGGAKGDSRWLMGRRSISSAHSGISMSDDLFTYTYLCADIAHKRIVPIIVEVRARSLNEIGQLWSHVGEAFLYVLEGTIELHTELYEPSILEAGDSIYFDSTMGHAYIARGQLPARLLVTHSSATPNLAQILREVLSKRLRREVARPSDLNKADGISVAGSSSRLHRIGSQ